MENYYYSVQKRTLSKDGTTVYKDWAEIFKRPYTADINTEMKCLEKETALQKKNKTLINYTEYKCEKKPLELSIEGLLEIKDNSEECTCPEESESWFEVNSKNLEEILVLFAGKKVKINIEVIE